jgi:hypothetical protein
MGKVILNSGPLRKDQNTTILIFTEGTVLGPRTLLDFPNVSKYVPIKQAVGKLIKWSEQGAEILYLTSRRRPEEVNDVAMILQENGFPGTSLYYREKDEEYKDIAERLIPDILIEDDCRSIGGKNQMTITKVKKEIKMRIRSVVVEEFGGIDHLPDDISEL